MIFQPFPKLSRLTRDCVITEKIDGTNAQVLIAPASEVEDPTTALSVFQKVIAFKDGCYLFAGSRTRFITPTDDNYGFAQWVKANSDELFGLGPDSHFGEWWGGGVQRGYGLEKGEKRFSLFNTARWNADTKPACCSVVPVLFTGEFHTENVSTQIERLRSLGSVAAPGFMDPEGVVVYHTASGTMFKKTLKNDAQPKSLVA